MTTSWNLDRQKHLVLATCILWQAQMLQRLANVCKKLYSLISSTQEYHELLLNLAPTSTTGNCLIKVPVLPPYILFRAVHHAGILQFTRSLLGQTGAGAIEGWWRQAMQQEWLEDHPCARAASLKHVVPLLFHIDGAEVYKNSELYVWSWRSCLTSHEDVLDTQMYFFIAACVDEKQGHQSTCPQGTRKICPMEFATHVSRHSPLARFLR